MTEGVDRRAANHDVVCTLAVFSHQDLAPATLSFLWWAIRQPRLRQGRPRRLSRAACLLLGAPGHLALGSRPTERKRATPGLRVRGRRRWEPLPPR